MGNSEVGHNTMGAGEVIPQIAMAVDQAFQSGRIFEGTVWRDAINNVQKHQSTLHFIGIISDGGVHSHISHLEQMLKQAHKQEVKRVRIHILTDGRDVDPQSEPKYIDRIESFIESLGEDDYKIASGGGRMVITADRYENDWGMVEKGWRTHVLGEGKQFKNAKEAIKFHRQLKPDLQDQYIPPFVIAENGEPIGTINNGDSVVYLDFRSDRALEISKAFTEPRFRHFKRGRAPKIYFAGMTEYSTDDHIPANYLVSQPKFQHPLPQYLSQHNIKQFAISETVKFGHITYYFNGNRHKVPATESRLEIPSYTEPFDTRPWMKCAEITDELLDNLEKFDFVRVNFPGGDMVGHTADMEATIVAMESIDLSLARIAKKVDELGGVLIIAADHGNAEELLDKDGNKKTSHTLNKIPCIIYDNTENRYKYNTVPVYEPGLANLASTIAILLGQNDYPDSWEKPLISVL
jgi:2,3-bisphosphoglycerate-independent phosphoglycerate mutase